MALCPVCTLQPFLLGILPPPSKAAQDTCAWPHLSSPLLPFKFLQDTLFIPPFSFTSSVNSQFQNSEKWRSKASKASKACRPPELCPVTTSPGIMSTEPGAWEKETPGGKTDTARYAGQPDIHSFTALCHYPFIHSSSPSLSQSVLWSIQCPARHSGKTEVSKVHPSPRVLHTPGQWLTSSV